ncbi:ABC transporter permease [Pseudolactococcus yaeyamensis]
MDIIDQSTINGLLALGVTFVIITGGIDLSIGSIFAVVIVVIGNFLVQGLVAPVAIIAGCIVGAVLGAINGIVITKMKLQPFIATLGTMSVYRGCAYIITGGWPVLNIPKSFRNLMDGAVFLNISSAIFILIIFAVICFILLKFTKFGTFLLAIGGNEEATRLSGVNVDRTKMLAYAFCGIAAALAGMVMLARLGSGEPTAGQAYEMDAIAATAIGGASLSGGRGSVIGTFLGAILLSTLKVGLVVVGVDSFWQYVATGAIIVVAAYFEILQSKLSGLSFLKKK